MNYRYFHDEAARTLYRMPEQPNVYPRTQGRGNRSKIIGWTVSMQVDNVRADNKLDAHRWAHPTFYIRQEFYPALQHSKDDALHYFLLSNSPEGDEISREEYERLAAQYQPASQ
ncbi:hypothetical protein [Trinickia sp.]|uniref:hypothetical protein n=1 Tax=Trinickia sp. TaxID=2571163 RepID=UPI003F803501